MDISITPAAPEEAQELSKLRHQVWQTTYRGIYPDEMIDHFDYAFHNRMDLMRIRSEDYMVYFLTADEEKAGYLVLKKGEPFRLLSLYLLPQYRGMGIGSMAFRFVRDYCRSNGIPIFVLDCHPENTDALAFYRKMGGVVTKWDAGHAQKEEDEAELRFAV